jgi:hypothetical protein
MRRGLIFQHSISPRSCSHCSKGLYVSPSSGTAAQAIKNRFEVANKMDAYYQRVKFDFVVMLGDNIYGGHSPVDLQRKFEEPYGPLLNSGVKFYALLGNHTILISSACTSPSTWAASATTHSKKGDVRFYALDSNYMDAKQLTWLEQNLRSSNVRWKICFFHRFTMTESHTAPTLTCATNFRRS